METRALRAASNWDVTWRYSARKAASFADAAAPAREGDAEPSGTFPGFFARHSPTE